MAESEAELKSLSMTVKEETEKAGLKLNIQKPKIMVSGHTMANRKGKEWKQWQILFSWTSKSLQMVAAAMKLKFSSPWKKSYDKHGILKIREITLVTKVHKVKSMVLLGVMHKYESCNIRKTECCRIDAFELCCWRRLLSVPWMARSNQSTLKEINAGYSLETLMLKLKLRSFGHQM